MILDYATERETCDIFMLQSTKQNKGGRENENERGNNQ